MKRFLIAAWLVMTGLNLGLIPLAWAAQDGVVLTDQAAVHQYANPSSPEIGKLKKGAHIRLSSDLAHDVRGDYWYKVRLYTGEFGYVLATDVKGVELDQELKSAGVTEAHVRPVERDAGELPWIFVLRAMGLAGVSTGDTTFLAGGEAEASYTVFFWKHGYDHRILSLGPAVQFFSGDTVLLGSAILRIFSNGRAEPEIRLRGGMGLTSQAGYLGANVGMRYPFSLDSGPHFCGYVELGGLAALTSAAPVFFFGSAGMGFHF